MNKEKWFEHIEQNDCYPKHSHCFIVSSYVGSPKRLYRNFGPFSTQEEAMEWMRDYVKRYTQPGFITEYRTVPICEVLPADSSESVVEELKAISSNLLENQKILNPDFERTVRENLWDLYD